MQDLTNGKERMRLLSALNHWSNLPGSWNYSFKVQKLNVQPLSFGFRWPVPLHTWSHQKLGCSEEQAISVPDECQASNMGRNTSPKCIYFLPAETIWFQHPDILCQNLNGLSTPELPFPGPWPVNTSSLTAAWPAVEQALNESCWFWSVRIPSWSLGDHMSHCLPTTPSVVWLPHIPWRICSSSACRCKFCSLYLAHILMSGKTLQENNSLLKRRAPKTLLFSSEKAFLLAGICLWCLQPKYHTNLKITLIRNWFLKQIMFFSWQTVMNSHHWVFLIL